ncbi:replication restart helicase PriA [Spongiivirga citrea]|uniref:Replication restart protein PriA n=1 Tax=Spongiivirga citrea TaxID=1481457 RepID=A0A6M0CUP5_9FLAO|nr:primosomal protein N' [Spongiivirga citrea]NER17490.1 primosomal protein N' [Spongiivirga citrea]
MKYFIDVILPIPLQKLFTYSITEAEFHFLKPGFRVAVPFGKRKVYTALVVNVHQNPPEVYEAKSIQQILDEKAVVTSQQLALWKWISSYYMCSLGDIFRAAMPSAFLLESETVVYLNGEKEVDENELDDHEFLVIEALGHQSSLKIEDLWAILDTKKVLPVINRLIEKELVTVQEEIYEQYKPKEEVYVLLHEQFSSEEKMHTLLDDLSRAPKQREVVMRLFSLSASTKKPVKKSELQKESQVSAAVIKSLIDKDILKTYKKQIDRVSFEGETNEVKELNEYQQTAFKEIEESFKSKEVTLLHGVTSSGKTEIYVQLIENEIAKGKQVLYLVPEIALTTQLIHRLRHYFGEAVSIYHSKYSVNERVEVWNNTLNNSPKTKLVVGARSSIFLPFNNLGLVIVDEEHETSYKQFDPAPRYHARDTAIVLANIFKAKVLMGTATPAVESYFNAKAGKYGLVNLDRRFGNVLMPEIELIDLKDKHKKKRMTGHFSDRLLEAIAEALDNNEQVILFKNRRGFSPIVECGTCGHSPQCSNCDVSLTYHQYKNELRCHYCGYRMAMQTNCQACGVANLDSKGFGTQQVEAELKELFPKVKVGRMDLDTTRGKHGYEKIINAFESEEIQILVGTQMLTKGLDFRNVGLVGIMSADAMLNFPDFRAHERSFHLMVQVAGRAGRTQKRGKVLIQSFNPYHQILQQVSVNDYDGMFTDQVNERRQYEYPPFFRLIKVTLKHKDYNKVNRGADWLAQYLKNGFGKYVLGPEFPPVSRIRNQYHKNILIKIPKEQSLGNTKTYIKKIRNSFEAVPDFRSIRLIIDVDNY